MRRRRRRRRIDGCPFNTCVHRRKLVGWVGRLVLPRVLGTFNYRMSQIKMGKMRLNHSSICFHPCPPLLPPNTHIVDWTIISNAYTCTVYVYRVYWCIVQHLVLTIEALRYLEMSRTSWPKTQETWIFSCTAVTTLNRALVRFIALCECWS
jgi:hypothetical protein